MAFSESNRAAIRRYLGISSIYRRSYGRFEDAISLSQSRADGGAMPDNSTELLIKDALAQLADIETELQSLRVQMSVKKAGSDDVELDNARGVFLLRSEARRHVRFIASTFGVDLAESDGLVF